jgi:hypothetical protein
VAMLPHEKAMVDRLKEKRFALLGINSDGNAEKVNEILKREAITWRNAVDGSTGGPWASKWNVSGWPTIYVLDAKGVIRAKDLRDDELEKQVVALLDEVEKTPAR